MYRWIIIRPYLFPYIWVTLLTNRKRLHSRSSTWMITFLNYCNLAFLHSRDRLARSRVHFAVTTKDHYELLCEAAMLFRQITEKILLRIDSRGLRVREDALNAILSPQNSIFAVGQRDFAFVAPMSLPSSRHNFRDIPESYVLETNKVLFKPTAIFPSQLCDLREHLWSNVRTVSSECVSRSKNRWNFSHLYSNKD